MGTATGTAFRNGRSRAKSEGDTMWRGPLEAFAPPEPIASLEDAAERMFTDGFLQLPDLFTRDEVAAVRAWMDAAGGPDAAYEVRNWCFNKSIPADFTSDASWLRLVDRAPVPDLLRLVFGAEPQVDWAHLWVTGRGRAMGIHADHFDVTLPEDVLRDERVRVPIFNATLHLYFEDQVAEIGPTLVIPGSHRAGRPPRDESTWNGVAPKMVSVRAGGGVLFRHDLWHGAAMNTSERRRHLIQVRYSDLRGPEGPVRRVDPAVFAQATPAQRALLRLAPSDAP